MGSKKGFMRKIPQGESKIHSIVFLKLHCSLLVCNKQHVELVEPHVLTYCPWARMIETRTSSICKASFLCIQNLQQDKQLPGQQLNARA